MIEATGVLATDDVFTPPCVGKLSSRRAQVLRRYPHLENLVDELFRSLDEALEGLLPSHDWSTGASSLPQRTVTCEMDCTFGRATVDFERNL